MTSDETTNTDPNENFSDEDEARGLGLRKTYGGSAYVMSTGRVGGDFHRSEMYEAADPPRGQQPALSPSATRETFEDMNEAQKAHQGIPNTAATTLYPERYGPTRQGDEQLAEDAREQAEANAEARKEQSAQQSAVADAREGAIDEAIERRGGTVGKGARRPAGQ